MLLCEVQVLKRHMRASNILVAFGFMPSTSEPLHLRAWDLALREESLPPNTVQIIPFRLKR